MRRCGPFARCAAAGLLLSMPSVVGCTPAVPSGQLLCEDDTECPSGFECQIAHDPDLTPTRSYCYELSCRTDEDEDGQIGVECGGADCDDRAPRTHLTADELCDGVDNDCDGVTDESSVCFGHPSPPRCLVLLGAAQRWPDDPSEVVLRFSNVCESSVTVRSVRFDATVSRELSVADASALALDATCEGDPSAVCEGATEVPSGEAIGPLVIGSDGAEGMGTLVVTTDDEDLRFELAVWRPECHWDCDAGVAAPREAGQYRDWVACRESGGSCGDMECGPFSWCR